MLTLEVEWLMGTCFAARSPADESPDWPIEFDRIFSALVATWGARGERPEEREALEWLEGLKPPSVAAAVPWLRTTATVFVPPNDASQTDIRILPEQRRRQPRQFPAVGLRNGGEGHLLLTWQAEAPTEHLNALIALAQDTSYIGHSSALVRCRFVAGAAIRLEGAAARPSRRVPYPGRLQQLERLHARHMQGDERARPGPGRWLDEHRAEKAVPQSVFASDWIVLEHAGGERPDLRATALVSRTLRDALMGAHPERVPEWLSGHRENGSPTDKPHLAVVPMANVGFAWSDGEMKGLGLVLPRKLSAAWEHPTPETYKEKRAFLGALQHLGGRDGAIELRLGRGGVWLLRHQLAPEMASLKPYRYGLARARWTTVTPIALDRHPKAEGAARLEEVADIIAQSCERIGLPRPNQVRPHKHPSASDVPSAWPAGGSPSWHNWARPRSLAGRPLFHAVLQFAEPVRGPVLLGAGRFFGLGLCLPLDASE